VDSVDIQYCMSHKYPTVNFKISRLTRLLNVDSMTREKGAAASDRAVVTGDGDGRG
jgi:hypothetical protein